MNEDNCYVCITFNSMTHSYETEIIFMANAFSENKFHLDIDMLAYSDSTFYI